MVDFVTDCCLAGTCHMVYAFLYFFNRFIGHFQIVTSKIFAFFLLKICEQKKKTCCILVSHCCLSRGYLASLIGVHRFSRDCQAARAGHGTDKRTLSSHSQRVICVL